MITDTGTNETQQIAEKKSLPFNTEQLLKAVDGSSSRSRSILLLLTFTSFLTLMALVNSVTPDFNWFKSKSELRKEILKYVLMPSEINDITTLKSVKQPVHTLGEFIKINESLSGNTATNIELIKYANLMDVDYPLNKYYALKNPLLFPVFGSTFSSRKEGYKKLGKSFTLLNNHQYLEKQTLLNEITKLDDTQVEHLDLIRVPILGISFHENYLGVYSGLLIIILLILFYFSLLREKINLKITFKRGWIDIKHHHYYLYEYAAMQQVLSIPKRLFARNSPNRTYMIFSKLAVFFPLFVYTLLLGYDFGTIWLGMESSPNLTIICMTLSGLFFFIILGYSIMVLKEWNKLDRLWDNQAIEFNLEYILEAIGEDPELDLIELVKPQLNKNDKEHVKTLWVNLLITAFRKRSTISQKKAAELLTNLINNGFDKQFAPLKEQYSADVVNGIWESLKEWHKKSGRKNVGSTFRTTLVDMINQQKLILENSVQR